MARMGQLHPDRDLPQLDQGLAGYNPSNAEQVLAQDLQSLVAKFLMFHCQKSLVEKYVPAFDLAFTIVLDGVESWLLGSGPPSRVGGDTNIWQGHDDNAGPEEQQGSFHAIRI
jgi:hypothetical protein